MWKNNINNCLQNIVIINNFILTFNKYYNVYLIFVINNNSWNTFLATKKINFLIKFGQIINKLLIINYINKIV